MLTYSFENLAGESMYAHLYKCIKNDISAGVIKPDTKLPSKRMLAKNLGVSLITVENAYAQLMVEGYIYSLPKRGYYAAQIQPVNRSTSLETKTALQIKQTEYFADFIRSSVPPDTFPYNIWARLMRQTLSSVDQHSLMSDTSAGGVLTLRQALAKHLYQFRGMKAAPEQIIVGAGTQSLYNLVVQLLGRSHIYALEDPGYPQLAQVYDHNDVFCRFIPMDDKGVQPEVLASSNADILHITPSHQFPTGILMPISRRYELLGWAIAKSSRYIIEDDYDCEFRLYGKPVPPLQSIDKEEKVIYINTFSKTLSPTFRISYMLLPPHLASMFYDKLGFYSCTVSNFEQFTLAKFIEEGHLERHINRMRTYYRNKRDEILKYIDNSQLNPALQVVGEDGGLHFLLKLNTDASDTEIKAAAQKQGINIKFLSEYYHHPTNASSHTLLMNYSGLSDEVLYPALDKLFKVLHPYLKI